MTVKFGGRACVTQRSLQRGEILFRGAQTTDGRHAGLQDTYALLYDGEI